MADLLGVIEQTGIQFKKVSAAKGGIWKGPCPWCGGHDRFSIYPLDNEGWYICNQCKKTGDSIQFERDYNGLPFKQACERVGDTEKAGRGRKKSAQKEKQNEVWEPRIIEVPGNIWSKKAESICYSTFKYLMSGQGAKDRDYLITSRGLTVDTIKKARLGFNPNPINYGYDTFGLPPEKDQKGKDKTVWIPSGIIIPYFKDGVRRLRVRNANPFGKNPYVLITGGSTEYFIYPGASKSKKTVVVESELDGWLVWQVAGDLVNVMAAGNAQTRPDTDAFELLSSGQGILCAFDFDDAGKKESEWWTEHFKAKYWPVPRGKDPGEAFVIGVDLRDWAQSGVDKIDGVRHYSGVSIIDEPGPSVSFETAIQEPEQTQEVVENKQTIPEIPEIRITVSYINETTVCHNGESCFHIKDGRCLLAGDYIYYIRSCPKKKWWIWQDPECDGLSMVVKGISQ